MNSSKIWNFYISLLYFTHTFLKTQYLTGIIKNYWIALCNEFNEVTETINWILNVGNDYTRIYIA